MDYLCNTRFDVSSRREFLTKTSFGVGGVALATILQDLQAAVSTTSNCC